MLIAVQSDNRQHIEALPQDVKGAHWLFDALGRKLVFIEGREGRWTLQPCDGLEVKGAQHEQSAIALSPNKISVVNLCDSNQRTWCLAFYPDNISALSSKTLGFEGNARISVGRASDNTIVLDDSFVSSHHMELEYKDGTWTVSDLSSSNGVFINGVRLESGASKTVAYGTVVSILGFHVALGSGLFSLNNPAGAVHYDPSRFIEYRAPRMNPGKQEGTPKDAELFYPALRFARSIEQRSFTIDAPPPPEQEEEQSLAMRIGPSFAMALASILSACVSISLLSQNGGSMLRVIPMIGMAVAMLAGSVVWPVINSRSEKKRRKEHETKRRGMYSQYLSKKMNEIAQAAEDHKAILLQSRVSVQDCLEAAAMGDAHLMDRTSLHEDYLDIRIGKGDEEFRADVHFPDQRFSLEDDDLREAVDRQAMQPRILKEVPLAFPLIEKNIVGVVGNRDLTVAFVRGMIVQVASLCSYGDVKIIVLCDQQQKDEWLFASHLPHCFTDDRKQRFFACGLEEVNALGMFLEREIDARNKESQFKAREAKPYYLVVCPSEQIADKSNIVRTICALKQNVGISLIAVAPEMKDLPKECASVINVDARDSHLLNRDDPSSMRKPFAPDIFVDKDTAEAFARHMSAKQLDLKLESERIPNSLGFLEMLEVGSVNHLNIASRWKESNASATLACCVGVDSQGEPFMLNLHEKFHGPHGLIAGTTGSGKSEFIITYILSMALTYSPDEVAFVLIDYKGGGLAKAFDNEHVRLPHLSGVITNLDGTAITRSLASIQSELKRRQALFNKARDVIGGDNIDIYDYLDLFRQGKMTEACPHLFIVADEFAELKQQEPEFMDELISAARIGRSLGVHLVLATQKPSGVVNDQIWSNARFKVCLKVADAADSKEMIKRPDAAELQQAGRFYLLVGYNEFFALGQSGYAGTRYVERERFAAVSDNSVVMISNNGSPVVSVKPAVAESFAGKRPESVVVLDAIQACAAQEGKQARQLWLESLPALITVDELNKKYGEGQAPGQGFELNPVIGEYDDPNRQYQGLLTMPLSETGNALIYGTPDSGVETMLRAAIYSLITKLDARQLNIYALDFGTESLRAFQNAPQVGDIVGVNDEEKIQRFFAFMEKEFDERRKLMAAYGGSFQRYSMEHNEKSAMVVILNDTAAFMEAYPKLEDALGKLVRESGRGGIYLILTAAGVSSIRLKMRQNIRYTLACNLADTSDYSLIFGSMRGVPIPKGYARGLASFEDGVFEFQGAHLTRGADEYKFASQVSEQLMQESAAQGISPAPALPVAPERVQPELLAQGRAVDDLVPYGLYDDTLDVASFDFGESCMARCQFQRRKDGAAFAKALIAVVELRQTWKLLFLDLAQIMGSDAIDGYDFATQDDTEAKEVFNTLIAQMEAPDAAQQRILLMVSGVADFLNRAGFEAGSGFKAYLKGLRASGNARILLLDSMSETSYTYEDWFKAHMTSKDGLWVGPGLEGQNAISIAYTKGILPDSRMNAGKGYESVGGNVRLVHLVSLPDEGAVS